MIFQVAGKVFVWSRKIGAIKGKKSDKKPIVGFLKSSSKERGDLLTQKAFECPTMLIVLEEWEREMEMGG